MNGLHKTVVLVFWRNISHTSQSFLNSLSNEMWWYCFNLCPRLFRVFNFAYMRLMNTLPGTIARFRKFRIPVKLCIYLIVADFFRSDESHFIQSFLGGLSLHLNHLIESRVTNYDWPFGTLPFGLFWSNLDTRDLETYPRTYSGHFWNMSIFDNSRAVWVLFRKWVVSENQSFLDEGAIVTPLISLDLGGEVPRLNHGPICFPIQNT